MISLPRRALGTLAVAALAVVGVQLIGIAAASAHTNTVDGTATCQQDGTYAVTWTVHNTYAPEDETATVDTATPAGSSVSEATFDIAASGQHQITQTAIPGSSTTASISVHGTWHPDGYQGDATGQVGLAGVCGGTVPAAPTAANGACVNKIVIAPSVTTPDQQGVRFTLDHQPVAAGKHTVAAGTHTVTASSTTLRLVGRLTWTFEVSNAPGSCTPRETTTAPATPTVVQSQCTGTGTSTPTITLPTTTGITYSVSASAPYRTGETVTVSAVTRSGYTFGSLPAAWTRISAERATHTVVFDRAPSCSGTEGTNRHRTPVVTTASVTGSSTGSSGLASTGPKTGLLLTISAGLLALGAVFLLGGRRRRTE